MDAKGHILKEARFLFAEKGFEATSLREIATKADVNVAMVAYYFGDKEGLYLTCIAEFARGRLDLVKEIFTAPASREDFEVKFKLFLQTVFATLANESDMVRIIMREVQTRREKSSFSDSIFNSLNPMFELIKTFLQSALDKKIISDRFNAISLTTHLMGMMVHPFLCESMMERAVGYTLQDKDQQKLYVDHMIEFFFQGVYREKKSS